MLAKRIILFLTYMDGILFRTKKFNADYRYTDSFVSNTYADEIVIVNISKDTGKNQDLKFFEAITRITKNCFVPITVGGKIKNIEQIKNFQSCGADKILLGTLPYENSEMVNRIISKFGSQFVILSIDVKKNGKSYSVFVNNGKEKVDFNLDDYTKFILKFNPGEILINSIDRDGSLLGFDIDLCKHIKSLSRVPVLASGGFGNWTHSIEALKSANLDGICTSNIFHFTEKSLYALKEFLKKEKINVR
tara:strand:+ start:465 stop:1208 length:744 start_codon:yes stop_codon:yes gene_type:complete